MDKRFFRDLLTRRSSAWTFGLCLTGVLVLGTIVAVDSTQRGDTEQPETAFEQAYLEEESPNGAEGGSAEDGGTAGIGDMLQADASDSLTGAQPEEGDSAVDAASGNAAAQGEVSGDVSAESVTSGEADAENAASGDGQEQADETALTDGAADAAVSGDVSADAGAKGDYIDQETAQAASMHVISEEELIAANVNFSGNDTLLWPSAGTILIDYSMDGSVYFPTLDQYKYNPALVIGSEAGNQVVSAARGIVESLAVNDVTGLTMTVNIGNGYRLVYGQLKEACASEGDVVEAGSVIGYISEPTRFYSREGSNLYFQMTQDGTPVDPVLYLE